MARCEKFHKGIFTNYCAAPSTITEPVVRTVESCVKAMRSNL